MTLPFNRSGTTREGISLRSNDLDLDPMTLIYEVDLDIIKMYPHSENKASRSRLSEVRARTGQTDRQTDRHIHIRTDRRDRTNVLQRRICEWWKCRHQPDSEASVFICQAHNNVLPNTLKRKLVRSSATVEITRDAAIQVTQGHSLCQSTRCTCI